MKHYKKLLLGKLTDSAWELLERRDGIQWWLDESWRIRSVKQHWGFELLILFLVDPMYDGTDKDRHVWALSAVEKMPEQRPLDKDVATMPLQKGRFDMNLSTFVENIDAHRFRIDTSN